MKAKFSLSILATALTLVTATPAFADDNSDTGEDSGFLGGKKFGHSSSTTHLSAALTGTVGQGKAEYTANSSGGASGFEVGVTIPVDGTTLVDSNAAASAVVAVSITDKAGSYSCTLPVTNVFWKYTSTASTESANFQATVGISQASKTATAKIGSCTSGNTVAAPTISTGTVPPTATVPTTGTGTAATSVVVPTISTGDTISVTLNGTQLLSGTFQ